MSTLDQRLIDLLVCPLCKGRLQMLRDDAAQPRALGCPADRLAFPVRDGIPLMTEAEAQPYEPEEAP
jgi:uncharacterized protein YbaR (Trm112 family)